MIESEYLRRLGDQYAREHLQKWGPSPDKLSWEELCRQETSASANSTSVARKISRNALFMSRQLAILKEKSRSYGTEPFDPKDVLLRLRPVDATHIPMLCVDKDGIIIDWNRSMCDLTGISKQQMIGKSYEDVLEEWIPNLSSEYRQAAVEWLKEGAECDETSSEHDSDSEDEKVGDGCREDYLFPLPLPLRYDPSFKYASGKNMHHTEHVELLVARVKNNLIKVYPRLSSANGVPQYGFNEEDELGWFFDANGWAGGIEFTLRRKQFVPSLQVLCRESLPEDAVCDDGSGSLDIKATAAAATAAASSKPRGDEEDKDVHKHISNYIRFCDHIGMKYILEVLYNVRRTTRNASSRLKNLHFSEDWSTNPVTVEINKAVLIALEGSKFIVQSTEKEKMTWSFDFLKGSTKMGKYEKREMEWKQCERQRVWLTFLTYIAPVVVENKYYAHSMCEETSQCLTLENMDKKLLTLKIEGIVRSYGSYEEKEFKAWAVVQVPATLNFFQLHRVVCQTMNCRPEGTRETHEWKVPNIASDWERAVTDVYCENIQIGETYFVENGRREDYGHGTDLPFNRGVVLRQRISQTGAYFDQILPFFQEKDWSGCIKRYRDVGQIVACIHSTCISSVFYQPGTMALLQNGLCKYMTKYKLTCVKCDEFTGPVPTNPNINVMQPRCLRGKAEERDDDWSLTRVNKQLNHDRGCLRRNFSSNGSQAMTHLPWCMTTEGPINKLWEDEPDIPFPFATQLKGLDRRPMFLHGEPPLPGSGEYSTYVLTLDGRIDSRFRQEHIADMGGDFSVPFIYGRPGNRRCSHNYDMDDFDCNRCEGSIGEVWTREVDEEERKINLLQDEKSKAKGTKPEPNANLKKRKKDKEADSDKKPKAKQKTKKRPIAHKSQR